eukprot:tig00000681_g3103.t1
METAAASSSHGAGVALSPSSSSSYVSAAASPATPASSDSDSPGPLERRRRRRRARESSPTLLTPALAKCARTLRFGEAAAGSASTGAALLNLNLLDLPDELLAHIMRFVCHHPAGTLRGALGLRLVSPRLFGVASRAGCVLGPGRALAVDVSTVAQEYLRRGMWAAPAGVVSPHERLRALVAAICAGRGRGEPVELCIRSPTIARSPLAARELVRDAQAAQVMGVFAAAGRPTVVQQALQPVADRLQQVRVEPGQVGSAGLARDA